MPCTVAHSGYNVPKLAVAKAGSIQDIHVRVTAEELDTLREMAAGRQVAISTVARAMIRHFVIEWRAGRDVTTQLGGVVWTHRE